MRRLVALGTVVLTASVGISAAFAVGRPTTSAVDGPELTVSTLEGRPGDTLTVAGGDCAGDDLGDGDLAAQVWLTPAPGSVEWDPSFADPVASAVPDADGAWSVEIVVPEFTVEYRLEAGCFDEASPPGGFVYRHLLFVAH